MCDLIFSQFVWIFFSLLQISKSSYSFGFIPFQSMKLQQSIQPLTPPSFRKDHFLVNTSGGASSGSGGLFKSASAVSVGRDFSGSVTPIQHQRKISYQNSHLFRTSGSGSSSRTEISNLIRVRNSQLGKSAPSLSPSSVSDLYFIIHKGR